MDPLHAAAVDTVVLNAELQVQCSHFSLHAVSPAILHRNLV